MNGPRVVCAECNTPTESIASPLCTPCAHKFVFAHAFGTAAAESSSSLLQGLVRRLDEALNGVAGAAAKPQLVDIVSQVEDIVRKRGRWLLADAPSASINSAEIGSKPVDGQSVEQRARELLAAECERRSFLYEADSIRAFRENDRWRCAIDTIAAALRSAETAANRIRDLADMLDPTKQADTLRSAADHLRTVEQPSAPEPVALSRHSRAMLLNVLWHHQGGSSSVGQPLRSILGIGQHDYLNAEQLDEAKWIDSLLANAVAPPAPRESVLAADVFRIAGGDTECNPWPTASEALHVLRDLRERYNEALDSMPAALREAAHPDDAAVDRFSAALKAKLAEARAKGRGGWQNDEPGMQQRLSDMLREHVEKGDPRDVANFCAFLHQRGEAILPASEAAQEPVAFVPQRRPGAPFHPNFDTGDFSWMDVSSHDGGDDENWVSVPLYTHPAPQQRESAPLRPVTDEDVRAAWQAYEDSVRVGHAMGFAHKAALESFRSRLAGERVQGGGDAQ